MLAMFHSQAGILKVSLQVGQNENSIDFWIFDQIIRCFVPFTCILLSAFNSCRMGAVPNANQFYIWQSFDRDFMKLGYLTCSDKTNSNGFFQIFLLISYCVLNQLCYSSLE